MRNILRILFPAAIVAIASCGSDNSTTINHIDTTADSAVVVDTIPVDTIPVEALAAKMGGDTITPADKSQIFFSFTADPLKKKGTKLTAKQVKKRFMPLDPECDGEAMYKVERFFVLDSLNKIGEEPDHDLGMIAFAEIALLDTIKKTTDGCWVTWRIDYETVQACPYASGTLFMLSTYDAAGKNISTQCMARNEGGADAPISWTCLELTNIFMDGSFRCLYADSTEDYDENDKPVYSVMRKTFTGQISAGGKITRTELEIERSE
jgi:hypothetical protein